MPAFCFCAADFRRILSRPEVLLIALLRTPEGASIDEIMAATGWRSLSVRGAISGGLKKNLWLVVSSVKIEGRGRVYRLEDAG